MPNAWERYKQKLGETRPWHVIDPRVERVDKTESDRRYAVCQSCPRLIKATKQCRECGCVMPLKVTLKDAVCPLDKW
jgi:hypothetical protein